MGHTVLRYFIGITWAVSAIVGCSLVIRHIIYTYPYYGELFYPAMVLFSVAIAVGGISIIQWIYLRISAKVNQDP